MVLYIILDKLDVHLPDRLESGQLLLVEVEELANKCKFTLQELSPDTDSRYFICIKKLLRPSTRSPLECVCGLFEAISIG
jgi:hypothetical protein